MNLLLLVLLAIPHVFASSHTTGHEPLEIHIQDRDAAVTTRPESPKMTSPQSLATVEGSNVTLAWEPVQNADFYNVQVATDPGFYFTVVDERYYSDTKVVASSLKPGTTYFWRVAAGRTKNWNGYTKGTFAMASFSTSGVAPTAQPAPAAN